LSGRLAGAVGSFALLAIAFWADQHRRHSRPVQELCADLSVPLCEFTLRRACRARKDLVTHRVSLANQLRKHLCRVFPGAVGLFADIDSPISLTFLHRFDCHDAPTGSRPNDSPPGWPASATAAGSTPLCFTLA
jgi:hypothetical protein